MKQRREIVEEDYKNFVGDTARLNSLIKQLEKCQKERDKLIAQIDDLSKKGQLEENKSLIKQKMQSNLVQFQIVVNEIKELKKRI